MKTIQELEKLTDDELRVMLAETQGWIRVGPSVVPDRVWPCKSYVTGEDGNWMMFPPAGLDWGSAGISTGKCAASPPNYPADLNACHDVEATLKASGQVEFNGSLYYSQQTFYICNLADALQGSPAGTFSWAALGLNAGQAFEIANANPRFRTIALIATLQA